MITLAVLAGILFIALVVVSFCWDQAERDLEFLRNPSTPRRQSLYHHGGPLNGYEVHIDRSKGDTYIVALWEDCAYECILKKPSRKATLEYTGHVQKVESE